MGNEHIEEQIRTLNQKLDRVLEFVELQQRKREEWDDLVSDLSIVAKDAFQNTVQSLDKAGVEIDPCGFQCLLIKLLRNLDTLNELMEMMESTRDFLKDATPIFRQIGLDAIHKMNELEQKGIIDSYSKILHTLTDPGTVSGWARISEAVATVKMDDELDDKSLWQLFKQIRSPEVRRSLSYVLRLIGEIHKK